jgi:hemoglobin-like flavoprotein
MKWILCASLLVSLQAMTEARAYEADIHYSTTYVLARAAGWPETDALTIASANQGVDENPDTVAALEVDTTPSASSARFVASSFHQAGKNLELHCFSEIGGQRGVISEDVRKVMAGHFADVPRRDDDPRSHAKRMIALGAALHCQQDAYSHVDFGGACGAYPGSCSGHTYENLLDQVVFGLLKKHYFNPDHPAVSGPWLLQALQGTVNELVAHRPGTSRRSVPATRLAALSQALRESGLQLPDEARRDCNRYVAGKWLADYLDSAREPARLDTRTTLAPAVAITCKNPSLASATVVTIPAPRYPRLNADASPYLVRADGGYQRVGEGVVSASLPAVAAPRHARQAKLQLSHWSQLLALPLVTNALLPATGRDTAGNPARSSRNSPSERNGGRMTNDEILLVQRSWNQVLPIREEAAELFYRKLFELDPGLRRLFTGNMEQQGARLMQMITTAVGTLNRIDVLLPVVRVLGQRHSTYGVRDEHYDTVATALLWTLEQGLREHFTPEVKAAWTRVYGVLSQVMRTPHDAPRAA